MHENKQNEEIKVTNRLMNYSNRQEKTTPYDFSYKLRRAYNVNAQTCLLMNGLLTWQTQSLNYCRVSVLRWVVGCQSSWFECFLVWVCKGLSSADAMVVEGSNLTREQRTGDLPLNSKPVASSECWASTIRVTNESLLSKCDIVLEWHHMKRKVTVSRP